MMDVYLTKREIDQLLNLKRDEVEQLVREHGKDLVRERALAEQETMDEFARRETSTRNSLKFCLIHLLQALHLGQREVVVRCVQEIALVSYEEASCFVETYWEEPVPPPPKCVTIILCGYKPEHGYDVIAYKSGGETLCKENFPGKKAALQAVQGMEKAYKSLGYTVRLYT